MKRHLTEKEIIEYQFELISAEGAERIGGHLESCVDCRGLAEKLKLKFGALDLLRGEMKVPAGLICEAVEQAKRGGKSRIALFRRPVWTGVAAAVLLAGLIGFGVFKGTPKVESCSCSCASS